MFLLPLERVLRCHLLYLQIFYKDDLNYLRGIGCYAWDTPEILRVKQAGELQSEVRASSVSAFSSE